MLGWQLNLTGFAVAPVFAGVYGVADQAGEARNKMAREGVA
jgi:hypothetical protein